MNNNETFALDGVTVLSVGHTLPGLYCMAILRDLGASVIRVERPANDRGGSYEGMEDLFPVRSWSAGTDELRLNLKAEGGSSAFRRVASRVDVVIEGFRPGVMTGLGLDYDALATENPGLIYLAITGYGQSGPDRRKAGHDINYLAETGVLALSNPPALPGVTFADGLAGLSAAMNILAALHTRNRTGTGGYIDCAIIDGPLSLMATEFEHHWLHNANRGKGETHLTGSHPWYGVYPTRDEKYVALGAVEPPFYQNLVTNLGRGDLVGRQFVEADGLASLRREFSREIASKTRDELVASCAGSESCLSPVLDTAEVLESPGAARMRAADTAGNAVVRTPVRLPPAAVQQGGDTAEVLRKFGFSEPEIKALLG